MKENAPAKAPSTTAQWRAGYVGLMIQIVYDHQGHSMRRRKEAGALVSSVEHRSPAAQAGIRPGDVILALNSRRFSSIEQLHRLLNSANDDVALLVQRGNSTICVPVKFG